VRKSIQASRLFGRLFCCVENLLL